MPYNLLIYYFSRITSEAINNTSACITDSYPPLFISIIIAVFVTRPPFYYFSRTHRNRINSNGSVFYQYNKPVFQLFSAIERIFLLGKNNFDYYSHTLQFVKTSACDGHNLFI